MRRGCCWLCCTRSKGSVVACMDGMSCRNLSSAVTVASSFPNSKSLTRPTLAKACPEEARATRMTTYVVTSKSSRSCATATSNSRRISPRPRPRSKADHKASGSHSSLILALREAGWRS
ncbi:hypothetical protein IE81DRAFT_104704 [Ceraceosorus guamensis]|uniref:Uncharacterized protein n=1 Tax=Ceraceosorus guamensis TaxID=1522189 RepID=A0A316VZL7_9BASI|nr:hypothetical protein IE81DRAFT_104704 [Ceraceosorus guamensis]PWN43107.1 hypothetical protein IE81DRAFT_104704 [Ceraceosorus guamensis]